MNRFVRIFHIYYQELLLKELILIVTYILTFTSQVNFSILD